DGALARTTEPPARPRAVPIRRGRLGARASGSVNPAAGIALVVTAAFALGDWWAKLTHSRRLEYVCKPATMVALIVTALALAPAAGQDGGRAWFVAALVFSLAGDVFLMLPSDRFVAGLASFLVAHLCYVAGFWTDPPGAAAL